MRLVTFHRHLDEENALRVNFELDRGQVVRFVVQLECRFARTAEWTAVVRYDTAHGFAHCDRLHPYDDAAKTRIVTEDYNEALTFAIEDLEENWEAYRTRYQRWLEAR